MIYFFYFYFYSRNAMRIYHFHFLIRKYIISYVYLCILMDSIGLACFFPVFLLISSIFAEYTNWFIRFNQLRQNRRFPIDQSNNAHLTCILDGISVPIFSSFHVFFLFRRKNVTEQGQASCFQNTFSHIMKIYNQRLITS